MPLILGSRVRQISLYLSPEPGLQHEFKDSQGYAENLSQKSNKQANK